MNEQKANKTYKIFYLNPEFSTTRMVTMQEPVIENHPEDQFDTVLFLPEGEGRQGEGGLRTKGYFKKNTPDKPLISVITVVFNGEKYLEETIQSVIGQTYDNVEYIIIDGGSTDGTLDIIRKYANAIDYWVSEKDKGIYDAMNKGIQAATGVFIGLVNADDLFYPQVLKNVAIIAQANSQAAYTYGSTDLMDKTGSIYGNSSPLSKELSMDRRFREIPYPHLSVFVARHVYKKIGVFDTRFKLRADYDFILRVMQHGFRGEILPSTAGAFRSGGQSGGIETFLESRKVHCKHGVSLIKRELNFICSVIKFCFVRSMPLSIVCFLKQFRTSKHSYK
jgi:glycosyltransferase involved in cell wall biosynthesis